MHHLFADDAGASENRRRLEIRGDSYHHIVHVLRMREGDEISVSFPEDPAEYRYGIEAITAEEVLCTLRFVKEEGLELSSKIYLFQGLPKGDKMELIVQKAVELGAFEVIPVKMRRCVAKWDEKKTASRLKRLQAVAEAAAGQARRGIIPRVQTPMTMKEALHYAEANSDRILLPYELAEGMDRTRKMIGQLEKGQNLSVFIGPEGGFTEEEVAAAVAAGAQPITMGRRILRTETAGFTLLSWLMYQLE